MDSQQISNLAAHIRSSTERNNIFTISTSTLSYLLASFELIEEQSTSFNVTTNQNLKAELLRDLQFLHNFFQQTKTLKLYGDSYDDELITDITKFKNLNCLEFSKLNLNSIKGLQTLRSQLQKLLCQKTPNTLAEVLSHCGGDQSHPSCWNELKEASFISNNITELDSSLECVPWLHTLDLSHNEIKNIDCLSCLPNLKRLNLSYNKLEVIPLLKGQICSRLQNLILKNNFIEDITGLKSLTNLCVLDLSNNCLLDHKSLLTLSYLATLQLLNLENNPLAFHPHHRTRTASYLHLNTASTRFVLDHVTISKSEKKLVGSYYPLHPSNLSHVASDTFSLSASDKGRRVREVVIEEEEPVIIHPPKLSASPQRYLETKKQIEDLHEKYGESWLNSQSGLLDVLGLENQNPPLSTSPYQADFTIYSGDFGDLPVEKNHTVEEEESKIEEHAVEVEEEDEEEGEESIYLATVKNESEPIFVVIGATHFSEKECSTSKERVRWHVDSIISCDVMEEDIKAVKVDFETMRKDRKQRVYVFEEEMDAFLASVRNKINSRKPKKEDDVKFQCMKCSAVFVNVRNESILGETSTVKCPNCDSNLVVEQ